MKNTLIYLTLISCLFLGACGGSSAPATTTEAGLDLESVLSLTKTVHSPQELEAKINEADGVNNLDLNQDGKVDYISVDEYEAQGSRNITLYVAYDTNNKQQVAEISCEKEQGDTSTCQIVGNDKVYGTTPVYQTRDNNTNNLLMDYLIYRAIFSPPYHSSYYYYSAPAAYPVRSYETYSSKVTAPTYRSPSISKGSLSPTMSSRISSSPMAGKSTSVASRSAVSSRSFSSGSSSSRPSTSSGSSSSRSSTSSRSTSSSSSSSSRSSSSGRR